MVFSTAGEAGFATEPPLSYLLQLVAARSPLTNVGAVTLRDTGALRVNLSGFWAFSLSFLNVALR